MSSTVNGQETIRKPASFGSVEKITHLRLFLYFLQPAKELGYIPSLDHELIGSDQKPCMAK